MGYSATGWSQGAFRQGFGQLSIDESSLIWRQYLPGVFSIFGLVPGWAPDVFSVPLQRISEIIIEQPFMSPRIVRVLADDVQYTFWVGLSPFNTRSSKASRAFSDELMKAANNNGTSVRLTIKKVGRLPLLLAVILQFLIAWAAIFFGFYLGGETIHRALIITTLMMVAWGVLALWAYT